MKTILLLLVILLFSACTKKPISVSNTDNIDINVGELFTHEGCTVYRFSDNGDYHYYAHCVNGSSETIVRRHEPCGRNCTRSYDENIPSY